MIKQLNQTRLFSVALISAVVMMTGCGGDRSTLYDESGNMLSADSDTWIYETSAGKTMLARNFVYIPGGFDVDGDGENESGFWLAKYEARESNESVSTANLGSVGDLIRNHFLIYNSQTQRFDTQLPAENIYSDQLISTILGFSAKKVYFSDEGNATGSYSPIEAIVALEASQIEGVDWHISLPTEKQWMQVVQLVINNPRNWNNGEIEKNKLYQGITYEVSERRDFEIANGILGEDPNVPRDYTASIYDLSGNLAEWTRGMFAIGDRFLGGDGGEVEYNSLGTNTPKWWLPVLKGQTIPLHSIYGAGKYYDGSSKSGATDILNITGTTGYVDPYSVVARGGSRFIGDADLVGIGAAKLDFGPGFKDPSVGFRAASDYLP